MARGQGGAERVAAGGNGVEDIDETVPQQEDLRDVSGVRPAAH